ncbi:MAG TPA: ATP-binding cassette domain-containing protein [Acidobacteriaceae bacterium]|nr:ATP-binding cassette domain-containing protein [Acidobacteriaceae bacterium]
MSDISLKLRMQHSFRAGAAPQLDLNFALTAPWSVLFGPSGAGKSTILRAITGLLRPQACRVIFRGEALTDTAQNIFVAPHLRGIGLVSQRSALFPHLTVLENVRYGVCGDSNRAQAMLELFHAAHLAARRVQELSGGERQRVLLARALAPAPRLLLLDEPFAGLDITLRSELLDGLRGYLSFKNPGQLMPVLSVTHDVSEVFALDADVIVLDAGRVKDQGDARTVLAEQREMMLRILQ